jgi:hypothetical protein
MKTWKMQDATKNAFFFILVPPTLIHPAPITQTKQLRT